jgi:hypothetical protein
MFARSTHCVGRSIERDDLMTTSEETLDHVSAHAPKADHTDLHRLSPLTAR